VEVPKVAVAVEQVDIENPQVQLQDVIPHLL
jgi:hypothetical protein